jgi:hypothetical protein
VLDELGQLMRDLLTNRMRQVSNSAIIHTLLGSQEAVYLGGADLMHRGSKIHYLWLDYAFMSPSLKLG